MEKNKVKRTEKSNTKKVGQITKSVQKVVKEETSKSTRCKNGDCVIRDAYIKVLEGRIELLKDVLELIKKDGDYCFLHEDTRREVDFILYRV